MPEKTRRLALITGASSGIGLELARVFARHGYDLILVARREAELKNLADGLMAQHRIQATTLPADLSQSDAPQAIFDSVQGMGRAVDVLVNNAGFGSYGAFHQKEVAGELAMLQVNIVALTHLTRLFLPGMVKQKRGKILNVASTAAFLPGPLMAVYYASKAYVLSFSEAIANELHGTGVSVTTLCPGPTTTEFQKAAGMLNSKLVEATRMDAATVAEAGYHGLMRRRTLVIPGARNVAIPWLARLMPREWLASFIRKVQESKEK